MYVLSLGFSFHKVSDQLSYQSRWRWLYQCWSLSKDYLGIAINGLNIFDTSPSSRPKYVALPHHTTWHDTWGEGFNLSNVSKLWIVLTYGMALLWHVDPIMGEMEFDVVIFIIIDSGVEQPRDATYPLHCRGFLVVVGLFREGSCSTLQLVFFDKWRGSDSFHIQRSKSLVPPSIGLLQWMTTIW